MPSKTRGGKTVPFAERCPRIQEKCEFKERDICKKDKNCPDNMKCCVFSCGKKCLDLKQGRIQSVGITDPSPKSSLSATWAAFVAGLLRVGL